jgi:hypothetical protein
VEYKFYNIRMRAGSSILIAPHFPQLFAITLDFTKLTNNSFSKQKLNEEL